MANTVKLHRVLRCAPDRIYRAFLNPDALVKWLPPHGFTASMHEMSAQIGGGYACHLPILVTKKAIALARLIQI